MDWVSKTLKQVKLPDAVKQIFNVDDEEEDVEDEVILHCKNGSPAHLLAALDDGDMDAVDKNGRTGLWWAAYHGHAECVEILMKANADVDLGDKWGFTPLISSCMKGRDECTRLLSPVASLDKRNESGCTAAWWAASNGHAKCLHILAKRGANLELPDERDWTPASQASKNDHIECLRVLVLGNAATFDKEKKRAPKRKRKQSSNPQNRMPGKVQFEEPIAVHEDDGGGASRSRSHSAPKGMSSEERQDSDSSAKAKRKMSAPTRLRKLSREVSKSPRKNSKSSSPQKVRHPKKQERKKSDDAQIPNEPQKKRVTKKDHPYSQAQLDMQIVKYAKKGDIAKLKECIGRGANLDARDRALRTGVSCAAFQGHAEVLQYLIDEGAHCNLPDKLGNTPLIRAIRGDHPDIVRILCSKVDLDQCGNMSQTAAFCAASNGRAKILDILIQFGADPEIGDMQGNTPAHAASKYGRGQCILVLCSNGADLMAKNQAGKTPLDLSKTDEIRSILEEHLGAAFE